MKDFLYFPSMTKGSLALLYFPGSNPRIATRHLMRWINGCSFDGRVIRNELSIPRKKSSRAAR